MSTPNVPADVRDFIAWYLPDVEHLEVLMALQRNAARAWSPSAVAAELRIPTGTAADALERLARDNFLEVKISNEILYRFNPANPGLAAAARRCADFYSREREAMIDLLAANSGGSSD